MASQKQEELQSKTRQELYEMAKEQGIPGKSDMTKEELIQALSGSQRGGSSHQSGSHGRSSQQAQGRSGSRS
jgi:DNA end-binding protein Ku